MAAPLPFLDGGEFVLGQQPGAHLVDADAPADGFRHGRHVTGQHDDLPHARAMQARDHLGGIPPDLVRDGNDADQHPVPKDQHRRRAARRKPVDNTCCAGDVAIGDGLGRQQCQVPDRDPRPVDDGDDPLPGHRFDMLRQIAHRHASTGRGLQDGPGQRMLGAGFRARGQAEHLVVGEPVGERDDVDDLRPALGDRSGLVESHDIDAGRCLQELAALDQDAVAGPTADPGHDRHRDRDDERPGAADDEQREREIDVAGDDPGDGREQNDPRGVPLREAIHERLSLRVGILRLLDTTDDASQGRPGPDRPGADLQQAAHRDRSGENPIADELFHRHGFTGDRGLVDGATPADDDAVDRHLSPVLHQDRLAGGHRLGGHLDLLTVSQDDREIRCDGDQLGQRRTGLGECRRFQRVADREQEGHRGGLPVVADDDRPDGRDGDQQIDADHPGS